MSDEATTQDYEETIDLIEGLWPGWESNAAQAWAWRRQLKPLVQSILRKAIEVVYAERSTREPRLSYILTAYRAERSTSPNYRPAARSARRQDPEEVDEIRADAEDGRISLASLPVETIRRFKREAIEIVATCRGFTTPPGARHAAKQRDDFVTQVTDKLHDDPERWNDAFVLAVVACRDRAQGNERNDQLCLTSPTPT